MKYVVLLGLLGGLGLAGCGENNEEPASGAAPAAVDEAAGTAVEKTAAVAAAVAETVPVIATPPAAPKASADVRAKALGFARFLPADTQGYLGVFDAAGFVAEMRGSKVGRFLEDRAAQEGIDIDEVEAEPMASMALGLFAEEFAVAVGKGTPRQADNLVRLSELSNYHQMKSLVRMFDGEVGGVEDEDDFPMGLQEMMMLGSLLDDPEGGIAILEESRMPPITLAFKMSDADTREELVGMAQGGLQELFFMIGPDGQNIAEKVEITRGESTFSGLRLVGRKIAASIGDQEKEMLGQILDPASIERLVQSIGDKDLVIAVGVHDSYLVAFLGSDAGELQLAGSPGESLLAGKDFAFADAYLDENLLAVSSMTKELQEGVSKNTTGLGGIARGIRDGLAEAESLGDTRDLEVLLGLVGEQEKALFDAITYTPAGVVAYREDGLKVEAFGGSSPPDLDLDAVHRYGALADWEDAVFFANWVEDAEYSELALEYLDTIGETLYLGAKRFSALEIGDGNVEQFRAGFGMFDQMIRPHALEIWKAIREDLNTGLGSEGAIVVDLKGGLPTVPGIPQAVADEGTMPRIGMIAPVADAEQLGKSWKRLNGAIGELLKVAGEMTGQNIPMQKPMSSEKDDLKTWFFSIPFQNDQFVLSASQDKDDFYLSTSKNFVQELSAAIAAAEPDPARKGAYLEIDLKVLRKWLGEWIALADANADELPGGGELRNDLAEAREVLAIMDELDAISIHVRREDGTVRASLHIH